MSLRSQTAAIALLLGFLVPTGVVFGGETGKIVAKVIDGATQEALPGANIVVEGTALGASTDAEGNAVILHVPPGTYSVKTSLVGYTPLVIADVRISIDQTTNLGFELSEEGVSLGEVIVEAKRPLIQKDVSTSVSSITEGEIESLPVASVSDVVNLNAGVQDGFVIRGGRSDEASFKLDGVSLRDPRNNKPMANVPLSAIEEVSVERGGFRAEYGEVRSGIINVIGKEGGRSAYSGEITMRYRPYTTKYFGMDPYDPNSMWLRPYLDPAVAWTGTTNGTWDEFTQRQYPQFDGWNVISNRLLTDQDPTNDLSPAAAQRLFLWQHRRAAASEPDYTVDAGFGGPVPLVSKGLGDLRFHLAYRRNKEMLAIPLTVDDFTESDWVLRLTSDIAPSMVLSFSGTLGESENVAVNGTEQANSTDYIRSPQEIAEQIDLQPFTSSSRIFSDSYYSLGQVRQYSAAVKLTNILSSTTVYEVKVEHIAREYDTAPGRARDTSKIFEVAPGYFVDEAPFGWSPSPDVGIGDGMLLGGHTSTSRDYSKISATTFRFDLTSQANNENEIKTGVEFVYSNLNLDYGTVNLVFPESNAYVTWDRSPLRGAVYVQDKLETHGFIANLGVRLDYLNPNGEWYDVAPFDKTFYAAHLDDDQQYPLKDIPAEVTVSPRLGISHPVTEVSKLYFNYGHYKQLPTYEEIFQLSRGASQQVVNIGDPTLTQAKTISYELGYDHSLFDDYLLQVAAFYHDVSEDTAYAQYISADATVNYLLANNNGYADRRGFELTFRRSTGRWGGGFINYTYLVTSTGRFGRAQVYEDPSQQREYDRATDALYQARPLPQPYARANLFFHTPPDLGILLGDWSLSALALWQSGFYDTWAPKQLGEVATNVQRKDFFNLDLRLSKSFSLDQVRITLLMDMTNALNTKRLSFASFYDFNDQQDYYNSLHLPASTAYDNIIGDDRVGEYRDEGVAFQPIVQQGIVTDIQTPNPAVIYYEISSGRYMNFLNGTWSQVDDGRMSQVLEDKAYIDMPNQTSFTFLNPRQIYFGLTVTFNFE